MVILACLEAKRGYIRRKGLCPVERYLVSVLCPAPAPGLCPFLKPPQSLRPGLGCLAIALAPPFKADAEFLKKMRPGLFSGASKHLLRIQGEADGLPGRGDHAFGVGFVVGVSPAQVPAPAWPQDNSVTFRQSLPVSTQSPGQMFVERILQQILSCKMSRTASLAGLV